MVIWTITKIIWSHQNTSSKVPHCLSRLYTKILHFQVHYYSIFSFLSHSHIKYGILISTNDPISNAMSYAPRIILSYQERVNYSILSLMHQIMKFYSDKCEVREWRVQVSERGVQLRMREWKNNTSEECEGVTKAKIDKKTNVWEYYYTDG